MANKISPEIISQIAPLYEKLGVKTQVAKELGISVNTVTKYLADFDNAATPKQRTVVTPELIKKINERYEVTKNFAQVGRELGISPQTVKRHLTEENLQLAQREYEDRDALWFYIYRLFGEYSEEYPVNPWNITQIMKFRKQGMPFRGQLLALKYFYEVRHGSIEKAHGSVGILPFVYDDARHYYEQQARRADEIATEIKNQLEKDRVEIKYNPSDYIGAKKKKKLINLDELENAS